MFSTDSIWVTSGPYLHVFSIVVVPDLLIFLFLVGDIIFHHHDLIVSCDVLFRNPSVVNMDLTKHFHVFVLESDQVLVEFVSLDWNWTVVVEEKVEQGNVLSLSIILETEGLVSDVEHQVTEKPEEYLWWSVFSCFLNLISHILYLDIDILQAPFGF